MDVKRQLNMTLELLQRFYQLQELTSERLMKLKYSNYQSLFTTQHEWMIGQYVRDNLWLVWYCTQWVLKWHTVTFHHIIAANKRMYDLIDGVM
jgi:hypothetical protein